MESNSGMSFADFAAIMKNNNSLDGGMMWNNPFFYLIWLAMFGGGNGFGFGNNAAGAAMTNDQIQNLQNLMQDNHNADLAAQAIAGNANAINQLSEKFGISTANITAAINAMNSNMQTGMCGIKTEILQQGAAINLGNCQQSNLILQQSQALQNAVQNGFTQIGFNMEQNACAIKEATLAQTQTILDKMSQQEANAQAAKIAELQAQLSEQKILNAILNGGSTRTTSTTAG